MKNKLYLTGMILCLGIAVAQAQWAQKANFPGNSVYTTSFSIGNLGYILNGDATGNFRKYDPSNNTWTSLADFPFARINAVGFSVGNTGYIATGSNTAQTVLYNDLWAYNPATDTWTQKTSLPGSARASASAFVVGTKAYIGGGNNADLWEYDATNDSWVQKVNLPMGTSRFAVAFSINGKGYWGTGDYGGTTFPHNEFWEYNPGTNSWTRKADFAGGERSFAASFALNGKGYIGTGYSSFGAEDDDLWQYDPGTNAWTRMPDLGATERYEATGLVIGNAGYLGMGFASAGGGGSTTLKDFWQFSPASVSVRTVNNSQGIRIYPNPSNGQVLVSNLSERARIRVTDMLGKTVLEEDAGQDRLRLNLRPGQYFIQVMDKQGVTVEKVIVE